MAIISLEAVIGQAEHDSGLTIVNWQSALGIGNPLRTTRYRMVVSNREPVLGLLSCCEVKPVEKFV